MCLIYLQRLDVLTQLVYSGSSQQHLTHVLVLHTPRCGGQGQMCQCKVIEITFIRVKARRGHLFGFAVTHVGENILLNNSMKNVT